MTWRRRCSGHPGPGAGRRRAGATDLIGATPANIAKRAVADAQAQGIQCCVLAGLNTPMLLRALTYRNLPLAETREKALAGECRASCV